MLEFMRLGGFPMWVMLVSAIGVGAVAAVKSGARRSETLSTGTVLVLIEGVLGMALGMKAVSGAVDMIDGDKGSVVAAGLGELANDGIFAAALALALFAAALVTRRATAAAA